MHTLTHDQLTRRGIRLGLTRADAEDVAQEALLKAHQRAADDALAYKIHRDYAIDLLRSQRERPAGLDLDTRPGQEFATRMSRPTNPEDSLGFKDTIRALREMPNRRAAQAFFLKAYAGETYDDIAARLGVSRQRAFVLTGIATTHLKECFA